MLFRVSMTLAIAAALGAPASALAAFAHVVAPGESLSSVAAADGLSVEELAAANGLPTDATLVAGSTLMIPPRSEGGVAEAGVAPETAAGEAAAGKTTSAETAAGETAAGEAASSGEASGETAVSGEAAGTSSVPSSGADGDADNDDMAVVSDDGVVRTSASTVSAATSPGASAASEQPVGAAAEGSYGAPPYPTPQTVSAAEVGSIAAEDGVPPSLAEAIAYQESGFNNDLTSSAGARGVMQIMPGTWSWINEALASQSPLDPSSAASNVRGGVLLLRSLLEATRGDAALAAAGYYQGLPSVLQEGELPATRQYVQDVLALQRQFGG